MKNPNFRPLIKSQINEVISKIKESQYLEIQTGDTVTIPETYPDPIRMQGQTGEVIFIEDEHEQVIVKFGNGKIGAYRITTFDDRSTRNTTPIDTALDSKLSGSVYEVSEEDVEKQKEFNSELEKTMELSKKYKDSLMENLESDGYFVFYLNSENQWTQSTKKIFKSMNDAIDYIGDKKRLKVFKMVNKEMVGENKDEDVWDEDDKEPTLAAVNKKDSITTTANKLQQTVKQLKTTVEKYKSAEGAEKTKLLNRLKQLTKIKKELESLL